MTPCVWGSLVGVLGKFFEVDGAGMTQPLPPHFAVNTQLITMTRKNIPAGRPPQQISGPPIPQIPIVCNTFIGTSGEANRALLLSAICSLAAATNEDYDERGGRNGCSPQILKLAWSRWSRKTCFYGFNCFSVIGRYDPGVRLVTCFVNKTHRILC